MSDELSTRIDDAYCVKTLEITEDYVIFINNQLVEDAAIALYEQSERFTCHSSIQAETWYYVEMNPGIRPVCTITEIQRDESTMIIIICCSVFGIITLVILAIVIYQLYRAYKKKLFMKHYSTEHETSSFTSTEEFNELSDIK